MSNEFKFKISAQDDSKKAINSSKKNLSDYKKELLDLFKKSKNIESPFKNNEKYLKNISKEFKNINKAQNKFGSTFKKINSSGEDLADTLKSVNREDEVLAQKLTEKGKKLQSGIGLKNEIKNQMSNENMLQKQKPSSNIMKVDKLEVKNFKGGSGGGGNLSKDISNKISDKIDKNLSDGLGKIGAGVGMVAGGFIAAIGVAYSVMSAKANAFRQEANQQIQGLQQVGFGARGGIRGQKTAGGFYSGFQGVGPGGQSYFLTGKQQVEMMSEYARQTGAGRKEIENMMYGSRGGFSIGAAGQAYGLNPGQLAGQAGILQRFGRGEQGLNTLMSAMAGAERSGMGGARMQEFLDAFQEAVTQGVMTGSQRTNRSMLSGLETLMSTNDERLKALAPEILKTSTQTMNQAAMLQGSPQSNFLFQAVLRQRQKGGLNAGALDVSEQLASGSWLKNAQAALSYSQDMYGKNSPWSALTFSKGMGLNIASPKAQQELARMIEEGVGPGGKTLTQESFQSELQKRLQNTSRMIEETTKADYVESLHALSEANRDAAAAVNSLREVITSIVDRGYELGKGATQRFFNVEMGPTLPTQKGF